MVLIVMRGIVVSFGLDDLSELFFRLVLQLDSASSFVTALKVGHAAGQQSSLSPFVVFPRLHARMVNICAANRVRHGE